MFQVDANRETYKINRTKLLPNERDRHAIVVHVTISRLGVFSLKISSMEHLTWSFGIFIRTESVCIVTRGQEKPHAV